MNFKQLMQNVVKALEERNINNTYALFIEESESMAIVMGIIEDGNDSCHRLMQDIVAVAFDLFDCPVTVSHSHPTDGKIVVMSGQDKLGPHRLEDCCKASYKYAYEQWVKANRPEWFNASRMRFYHAFDVYLRGMDYTVDEAFDKIDWNSDPAAWLLEQMAETFAE